MAGSLWIVATPIGNLEDLSPRALRALAEADVIACEDTRVSRKLGSMASSRARLVAYNGPNERKKTPELVHEIAAGARVALVTDAGTPGVSDPGPRLVAACREAGLRVEVVPGPSAAVAALVASGLPTARFAFEGFLPRTGSARRRRLGELAGDDRTLIFFEAPHRISETLDDMFAVLGDRPAALARELTKLHEEVVVATLGDLAKAIAEHGARGEITLVVGGAPERLPVADQSLLASRIAELMESGATKKDAIATAAAEAGVPKKVAYQAAIDAGL